MSIHTLKARLENWRPQSFGKVAVLMGGTSAERQISLESGDAVLVACKELGLDAHPLDLGERPLQQIIKAEPNWAFNIVHGGYGENGLLASALELLGIHSPASGGRSMALAMHKHRAKALWRHAGLPTPDWCLLDTRELRHTQTPPMERARQAIADAGLHLPLVLKPVCEGSSIGLYLVYSESELTDALQATLPRFDELLIETLIEGTEITVAVIERTPLPVIEIRPDRGVYDYYAKYQSDATRMLIPTRLGQTTEAHASKLALAACQALGCTNWARVDAMVDSKGEIFLLELNTLPGMTSHSLVPYAATKAGLDFTRLVQTLFCVARDRLEL